MVYFVYLLTFSVHINQTWLQYMIEGNLSINDRALVHICDVTVMLNFYNDVKPKRMLLIFHKLYIQMCLCCLRKTNSITIFHVLIKVLTAPKYTYMYMWTKNVMIMYLRIKTLHLFNQFDVCMCLIQGIHIFFSILSFIVNWYWLSQPSSLYLNYFLQLTRCIITNFMS